MASMSSACGSLDFEPVAVVVSVVVVVVAAIIGGGGFAASTAATMKRLNGSHSGVRASHMKRLRSKSVKMMPLLLLLLLLLLLVVADKDDKCGVTNTSKSARLQSRTRSKLSRSAGVRRDRW
jgi:hypothetical protein